VVTVGDVAAVGGGIQTAEQDGVKKPPTKKRNPKLKQHPAAEEDNPASRITGFIWF
jgi:hypothetical protein